MKSFFTKSKIKNKVIGEIEDFINNNKTSILKEFNKKQVKTKNVSILLDNLISLKLLKEYRTELLKGNSGSVTLLKDIHKYLNLFTNNNSIQKRDEIASLLHDISYIKKKKIRYSNITKYTEDYKLKLDKVNKIIYDETSKLIEKYKDVKDNKKKFRNKLHTIIGDKIKRYENAAHSGHSSHSTERSELSKVKGYINNAYNDKGDKSSNKVYIGQRGGRYILKNGTKRYL